MMPDTEAKLLARREADARREAEEQSAAEKRRREERLVDLASEASFPASDAPPWTFGRQRRRRDAKTSTSNGSPGTNG